MRLRYKLLLVVMFGLFVVNFFHDQQLQPTFSKGEKVIVIDPGHGGRDPGKVGVNGALEKDINLEIAMMLKKYLKDHGFTVVMTREEDIGLYSEYTDNKKREDLLNRVRIIDSVKPTLTVSIHQNSFTDASCKGAQVFYHKNSEEGKAAADHILKALVKHVDKTNHRQIKPNGSYYLLKNSRATTVIIECGFMSNPDEAAMLSDVEYQNKVANGIFIGIVEYLEGK